MMGYGVIRSGLTALAETQESILYSIPEFIGNAGADSVEMKNVASSLLGIPSNILSSSDFQNTFMYRYLFAGFPDAIIAPSFFMLGYGIAGSSIADSRNFPAIFVAVIGLILQLVFFGMNPVIVLVNVLVGIGFGFMFGSYVSGDPVYGPYASVPSQQVSIVLNSPEE
jgi:hypothetical protein